MLGACQGMKLANKGSPVASGTGAQRRIKMDKSSLLKCMCLLAYIKHVIFFHFIFIHQGHRAILWVVAACQGFSWRISHSFGAFARMVGRIISQPPKPSPSTALLHWCSSQISIAANSKSCLGDPLFEVFCCNITNPSSPLITYLNPRNSKIIPVHLY